MKNYHEYKRLRALDFIQECELSGMKFSIEEFELCVSFSQSSCSNINMSWFSRNLEWLKEEIHEIIELRSRKTPMKLVVINGRSI
jgi:hypothetical protein